MKLTYKQKYLLIKHIAMFIGFSMLVAYMLVIVLEKGGFIC